MKGHPKHPFKKNKHGISGTVAHCGAGQQYRRGGGRGKVGMKGEVEMKDEVGMKDVLCHLVQPCSQNHFPVLPGKETTE